MTVWNRGLTAAPGIQPPLAGIFDSPNSGAVVNEKWKPLIISALAQLANNEHLWQSGYQFGSDEIAKLIECLIVGDCAEVACEEAGNCLTISPNSGFIEFLPADPFTEPGADVPPYDHHPFTVGENSIVPGARDTDVFSTFYNLTGLTTGSLPGLVDYFATDLIPYLATLPDDANFLPRFKVRFSGKGTVSLKLLKVPFGGKAYITLDGNPIGIMTDLNGLSANQILEGLEGLIAAAGSLFNSLLPLVGLGAGLYTGVFFQQEIIEIPVTTDGDHYIDCTFLPWIVPGDILPVEVGWGGGLRDITFCPDGSVIEIEAPECPEPPPVPTPELRQAGDCVEWLNPNTGLWECLLTVTSGATADCDECEDEDCEECDESEDCDECV